MGAISSPLRSPALCEQSFINPYAPLLQMPTKKIILFSLTLTLLIWMKGDGAVGGECNCECECHTFSLVLSCLFNSRALAAEKTREQERLTFVCRRCSLRFFLLGVAFEFFSFLCLAFWEFLANFRPSRIGKCTTNICIPYCICIKGHCGLYLILHT